MQKIALGSTGRITTQLGFGCSSIMGGLSERESLQLLDSAYDAGIRHFDVAPLYGYGAAERCLGKFLAKKSDATVTTKYGILPPKNPGLIALARKIAIPVVRRFPGLKKRLNRAGQSLSTEASFSPEEARASLDRSFRELKLDHIDIWLLHEPAVGALRDDVLLHFLQGRVASGQIGTFGIGGDGGKMPDLFAQRRPYCPVLQFEWSIKDSLPDFPGSFRIHHRALSQSFSLLHQGLSADPARTRRWSDAIGHDLGTEGKLARLMLKAALVMHPESVILFSSRKPAHILQNVSVAEDTQLELGARRLYELCQREPRSYAPEAA